MGLNNIKINNTTNVKSGVVYDISKATGQSYETLSDALSGNNVPLEIREGGMSIRFVQTSDNKYVQYRLMSDSFNTTVANWQGVDDEPTSGSDNLVKSGGVANKISKLVEKTSEITKDAINTEKESINIEDNNGNELFYLDENGLNAKDVKSNGKYVLTEHQDVSGLATKDELEKLLKLRPQSLYDIENNFTTNAKINLETLINEGKVIECDLAGMKFYRI